MNTPIENGHGAPIKLAAVLSMVLIAFVFSITVAIGGSYLLTLNAIHNQDKATAELHLRETQSQVRGAIPVCKALVEMDDASRPPVTNASNDPNSYGHKLARAITDVVKTTRCQLLLQKLASGESIARITKEMAPKDTQ